MAVMAANRVQGGLFTVMVLKIGDPYDPALDQDLAEQVARSPGFFSDAPVVIDLKDSLGCTSVADYVALKQLLRRHRLIPVGVQNASALQTRAAHSVDLAIFSGASGNAAQRRASPSEPAAAAVAAPAPRPAAPPPAPAAVAPPPPLPVERAAANPRSRLITQPVRSGMQLYAKGGDLVVVAPVSPGAELIADGHIHVYGALRGRALAGAAGDTDARIFAQRLEAELVSIAGRYLVSEAIAPELTRQPVQVSLVEDRLRITGWSNGRAEL